MSGKEISEYQKVAALLCNEIEILFHAKEIINDLDRLKGMISRLKNQKDKFTTDKESRDSSYLAVNTLFNLPMERKK